MAIDGGNEHVPLELLLPSLIVPDSRLSLAYEVVVHAILLPQNRHSSPTVQSLLIVDALSYQLLLQELLHGLLVGSRGSVYTILSEFNRVLT